MEKQRVSGPCRQSEHVLIFNGLNTWWSPIKKATSQKEKVQTKCSIKNAWARLQWHSHSEQHREFSPSFDDMTVSKYIIFDEKFIRRGNSRLHFTWHWTRDSSKTRTIMSECSCRVWVQYARRPLTGRNGRTVTMREFSYFICRQYTTIERLLLK